MVGELTTIIAGEVVKISLKNLKTLKTFLTICFLEQLLTEEDNSKHNPNNNNNVSNNNIIITEKQLIQ